MTFFRGAAIVLKGLLNGLCLALLNLFPLSALNAMETTMDGRMKTYCFGRFLVDVPRETELRASGHRYYVKSFETGRGTEEFRSKVKATLEKRKNGKLENSYEYVRSEHPEGSDTQIILSKEYRDIFDDTVFAFDVFALRQLGYYFSFTAEGRSEDAVEEYIKTYRESILPALRYRPEYDIPREPGFCFQDGFIASDGKGYVDSDGKHHTAEEASLAFRLKDHPDVWIRISSEVYFVPREPLLVRYNQGDLGDHRVRRDSIRKRETGGMQGDEMLLSGTLDGNVSYLYKWEALGEIKNPLKPGLTLDIRAGEPVGGKLFSSSLEKVQVRALYEMVLKSIRPRPTGEAAGPKPLDILIIETGE